MLKMTFWDSTTDDFTDFVAPDFESCVMGLVDTLGIENEDFLEFVGWSESLAREWASGDGVAEIIEVPDDMTGDTISLSVQRV
jgi:hypothetical protein